jgi:TatD DNase family protein
MFIDTHSHLQFESFDEDREMVIQRAIRNNIDAIITIGTDVYSSNEAVNLAQRFAVVFAAVGIHPNDSMNVDIDEFNRIKILANEDKVIAIGEIGLDYYRDYTTKSKQEESLREQIRIAHDVKLPLIIHNRDAHEDILLILKNEKAEKIGGVFHSFSGEIKFLESVLAENYYISFTGPITFKNANYNKLIDCVPLEQLLLETDSPFLSPVPFRGKRNEPAHLNYIAEKIAQVKGISTEELALITCDNTENLFHLKDQWQTKLNL